MLRKKIFTAATCFIMFMSITSSALAASTTFKGNFINGSTQYDTFKKTMDGLDLAKYPNITSGVTTSSLESYATKVDTANSKNFVAPYDSNNFENTYTIQGICYNTYNGVTYTLISAYKTGANSVIFIRSGNDSTYTKISIGGRTDHFGGIASAGSYTYITGENSNSILRIKDDDLFACYSAATSSTSGNITKANTLNNSKVGVVGISFAPDYLTYDTSTGYLWAGNFVASTTARMYAFNESALRTATSATSITSRQVPSCTQGASIRDGKLILTRSYVRTPVLSSGATSSQYVSELYCYNSVTAASPSKMYMLPPMAEGVIIGSTYTYIVFESNSQTYNNSILRTKNVLAAATTSLFN